MTRTSSKTNLSQKERRRRGMYRPHWV